MQFGTISLASRAIAEACIALPKKQAAVLDAPPPQLIGRPAAGYCGTTPSRPTLMRAASSVPSGFLVAASTVKWAPGLRSAAPPIS
jgi:hypothetical protein